MKHFFKTIRMIFRRGLKATLYSYEFNRELTKEEVQQLDDWMNGVNRAFDLVNKELGKMPRFAAEENRENKCGASAGPAKEGA
jgi:hypothetical protein